MKHYYNKRESKGRNLLSFPEDYTIIDLETTGYSPRYDEIIEVAGLKIKSGVVVKSFQQLIRPENEIDNYITELTGITQEMLENALSGESVLVDFLNFIENDIIIGHNINFDINFLYDNSLLLFNKPVSNDFVDTLRMSRLLFPQLEHHRLSDMTNFFNINVKNFHRALDDCYSAFYLFESIKKHIETNYDSTEDAFQVKKNRLIKPRMLISSDDFDSFINSLDVDNNNIKEKHFCFTGTLEKFTRQQACVIVEKSGGFFDKSVTSKTNFLIVGDLEYSKALIKDDKSSKQKKAESLILSGKDIIILSETDFYDMIFETGENND